MRIVPRETQSALPPARHPRDVVPHVCGTCRGEKIILTRGRARFDDRQSAWFPEHEERACPVCSGHGWVWL